MYNTDRRSSACTNMSVPTGYTRSSYNPATTSRATLDLSTLPESCIILDRHTSQRFIKSGNSISPLTDAYSATASRQYTGISRGRTQAGRGETIRGTTLFSPSDIDLAHTICETEALGYTTQVVNENGRQGVKFTVNWDESYINECQRMRTATSHRGSTSRGNYTTPNNNQTYTKQSNPYTQMGGGRYQESQT